MIRRVALITEASTLNRNRCLISVLCSMGVKVINAGMTGKAGEPTLSYIHTGFIAALLLHLRLVDFVIGGCGTGTGFLNSVLQYPNIICGLVHDRLEAWLFTRINGGNCISLALQHRFGWASEINLRHIFEEILHRPVRIGYPPQRKTVQRQARTQLRHVSQLVHKPFWQIVEALPSSILHPVLRLPLLRRHLLHVELRDRQLQEVVKKRHIQLVEGKRCITRSAL